MPVSRPYDYEDGSGVSARPQPERQGAGILGLLRWFWRQLTSMKVALILLLLLALATIPGSLVPQRAADPNGVAQFEVEHPELFKFLDSFPIQAFDVYTSVWFSAVYLLLFTSLVGCILPRIVHHTRALFNPPPKTPSRLNRMVGFSQLSVKNERASDDEKLEFAKRSVELAEQRLKKLRYRTVVAEENRRGVTAVSVSAERGYLRETGNLLFHIGLVGVLIAVGFGSGIKFNGQKAITEGETMVNSLIDYDTVTTSTYFDVSDLDPFRMRLDSLDVDYVDVEDQKPNALGNVEDYRANVTVFESDGSSFKSTIRVNEPLRQHGTPVYLITNGYAPHLTMRNAAGEVVFSEKVAFLPQDTNMVSIGVIKVPDGFTRYGEPVQVGFRGFFYPTKVVLEDTGAYTSNFPDLHNPLVTLDMYVGDLGINEGIPQSVYALNTDTMEVLTGRKLQQKSLEIGIGETVQLPEGMGTLTVEAVPRFAAFEVMHDPSAVWVLISSLVAFGGLIASLFVPRRRMWVKAIVTANGITLQYAGLARGDDPNLPKAVGQFRDAHRQALADSAVG